MLFPIAILICILPFDINNTYVFLIGLTPFHRYLKKTAVPSIFDPQASTDAGDNKDKPASKYI